MARLVNKIRHSFQRDHFVYDYMTLHIECWFNKNSLFQRYFLAIFPAGYWLIYTGKLSVS